MNVSKCFLGGRLVADPMVKKVGETTICDFTIAVSDGFGDKKSSSFFECQSFNKTADTIKQYFKKGSNIFVEGRLKQDKWTSKEGDARSKVVVKVDGFSFVDSVSQDKE